MSDFQLILLEQISRPPRGVEAAGEFSLIPFRTRAEIAMAERALTAEDVADWITPYQALETAVAAFGDDKIAKKAIFDRLSGGQIAAVAEKAVLEVPLRHQEVSWTKIDPGLWPSVFASELRQFWVTSQITIHRSHYPSFGTEVTFRFFGVKFDPSGVRALTANAPPKNPPARSTPLDTETVLTNAELQGYGYRSEPLSAPADTQQEKGPPVPNAHLQAWYAVYRQAYQGAADTEETAWKSARGMFPGKSVSRDAVRELRGAQKRGRKPSEPRNS